MSGKFLTKSILILTLALSLYGCQQGDKFITQNTPLQTTKTQNNNFSHSMKLTSPNFENNSLIPPKYTCQGLDISPELEISDVLEDAKSLALLVDDPDAPSGNWNHWVIWNIPANTKIIPENVGAKFAVQGNNSWPKQSYGGPCPPSGSHRYFFKLYALSQPLDLPPTANKADLEKAMQGLIIDEAQLMGTYKKTG